MKSILLLLIVLTTCLSTLTAQDFRISGKITSGGKPAEAATVSLLTADSGAVKQTVSDKTGAFILQHHSPGSYLVFVQLVGSEPHYSLAVLTEAQPELELPVINLKDEARLSDVVVTATRQAIEQKIDKTVINVDAAPTNAGLSAFEVLEKTPGVSIDKDGNISLKGKPGVMVMIDGKPTYLSAQDLTNYLKNLPSSALEQIELMTNPSAKYDAAGNAGIINFKTKKSKIKGFNTSVTLGAGMSKYAKANESINFNYRSGKVNVFGNYSYNYNKRFRDLEITRNFRDSSDNINTRFEQNTHMVDTRQSHYFKTGMDFYVSGNTTLGFAVNGNINPGNFDNDNVTNMFDANGSLVSTTYTKGTSDDNWKNYGANLNMSTRLDTSGRMLDVNLDYIRYKSMSEQLFVSSFYNEGGNKTGADESLRGNMPGNIHIYSGKVDYTHPLKRNAKIEAGVKTSYVENDNMASYDSLHNNDWVVDSGRTNHFIYKENINAVYVNGSKQFSKKWSAQVGLRLENTNGNGRQKTTGEAFTRRYTQLFPTAYVNYTMNDKNQLNVNYGRRIQRPDYSDLNPFYYFLDKYTYQVGNPYLKPQFSHNIELNHVYNNKITTTFSYAAINDVINEQLQQIDSTHTTYVTNTNLAKQRTVTLGVNAAIAITKWWRTNLYAQGSYNRFEGFVNTGNINVEGPAFNANMQNQFTLPEGWSMELTGYFNSKAVYGTIVGMAQGSVNVGVAKKIMKDKATLKLNVRDILGLQQWNGYSRYQNVDVTIHNTWDSRTINLSFTYRFSKGQKAEQRNNNSAGEEQSRVKGNG